MIMWRGKRIEIDELLIEDLRILAKELLAQIEFQNGFAYGHRKVNFESDEWEICPVCSGGPTLFPKGHKAKVHDMR